jgi:hypothetical protein
MPTSTSTAFRNRIEPRSMTAPALSVDEAYPTTPAGNYAWMIPMPTVANAFL